jgi:hypothetical protein
MNTKLLISVVAAASALSLNAVAADLVTSSDTNTINQWYGRAGGLAGSDRVSNLAAGTNKVGVVYDADVAARTNMPRAQAGNGNVAVTYDADVAARTNMPRGSLTFQPQQAGINGAKTN